MEPTAVAGTARRFLLLLGVAALCGVLVAGLVLPVVGAIGLAARSGSDTFQTLPANLTTTPLATRSVVFDADNKVLATFYEENRIPVKLAAVSEEMRNAIIAIEDARFYEHGPLDLRGTARAAVRNASAGGVEEGGSTLTQQYVKLLVSSTATTEAERDAATDDTLARKLRELRLAMAAEQQFTKDEILERYLNIAYFGGGAYGIEAAARRFFSVTASDLTVTQAATLAGLVQSPSAYDPERAPERALGRRNIVLAAMEKHGYLTPAEASKARQKALALDPKRTANGCSASYAPFFCDYVFRELLTYKSLGKTTEEREQALTRGGLRIKTTLDRKVQGAAQSAVSSYVAPTDEAIAAIGIVQPGTGRILAVAHSRGYGKGKGKTFINYAVDANRGGGLGFQPGSTMKAFVVAAAIKQGLPLSTSFNSPSSISMRGVPFKGCQGTVSDPSWEPKNYGTQSGNFNIRSGTASSVNTFFVQLQRQTGICDPWKIARSAGLTEASGQPLAEVPSFTLGPSNVSPLAMAEAYATFAAGGRHCNSVAVLSIENRAGKKLKVPTAKCDQVLDENVAYATVDVLRGVMTSGGTGTQMAFGGRQIGGKTGTNNDAKSVWFTGFTPQMSASVTVADAEAPLRSLDGIRLNGRYYSQACGSCIPGPIWRAAMEKALAGEPYKNFKSADPRKVNGLTVQVPDVRGLSQSNAISRLASVGLNAFVAGQADSSLPAGAVVYTNPSAYSSIGSGATVGLYVSTGRAPAPEPQPEPTAQPQATPAGPPNNGAKPTRKTP